MRDFVGILKNVFFLLTGVIALIIAFNIIDFNSFKNLLGNVSLVYFLIFLIFFFITFFLVSLKWFILIRALGGKVPIMETLKYSSMSFFISFVTPSLRLGGEPLKMYMLKKKHNVPYEKSAASIVGEIIIALPIELFVVLFLSSLVFLFADIGSNIKIVYFIFSILFLFFLGIIFISIYREKKIASNFLKVVYDISRNSYVWRFYMKIYSFEKIYITLLRRKRIFYSIVFYSFASVFTKILAFIFGFLALTRSLDLSTTFLSYIAFSFTSFFPIPGGLGIQEIGQVLLTQQSSSVAFSVLIRFWQVCLMLVGLFFIIKEGVIFGGTLKKFFIKLKNKITKY